MEDFKRGTMSVNRQQNKQRRFDYDNLMGSFCSILCNCKTIWKTSNTLPVTIRPGFRSVTPTEWKRPAIRRNVSLSLTFLRRNHWDEVKLLKRQQHFQGYICQGKWRSPAMIRAGYVKQAAKDFFSESDRKSSLRYYSNREVHVAFHLFFSR